MKRIFNILFFALILFPLQAKKDKKSEAEQAIKEEGCNKMLHNNIIYNILYKYYVTKSYTLSNYYYIEKET